MQLITTIWKKDKLIVIIIACMLTILLINNHYGYRICNCTSTDKWAPGGAGTHTGGHRSGVNGFYHK